MSSRDTRCNPTANPICQFVLPRPAVSLLHPIINPVNLNCCFYHFLRLTILWLCSSTSISAIKSDTSSYEDESPPPGRLPRNGSIEQNKITADLPSFQGYTDGKYLHCSAMRCLHGRQLLSINYIAGFSQHSAFLQYLITWI